MSASRTPPQNSPVAQVPGLIDRVRCRCVPKGNSVVVSVVAGDNIRDHQVEDFRSLLVAMLRNKLNGAGKEVRERLFGLEVEFVAKGGDDAEGYSRRAAEHIDELIQETTANCYKPLVYDLDETSRAKFANESGKRENEGVRKIQSSRGQHQEKRQAEELAREDKVFADLKMPLTLDTLRAKMRRAKEISGLTGEQIGEKMGVKTGRKQAVNDLLTRIGNPGIFTIASFAQATGHTLHELLALSDC